MAEIENMVKVEKNLASALMESVDRIKNTVVREILRSIAYDSQKHAGFYTVILSLQKDEDQGITEEDYDRLQTLIEGHIEVERLMTQKTKELLETEADSRVKHMLSAIYDDEVIHHTLMKNFLDAVIKRETYYEKDLWDKIWVQVHQTMG